MCKSAYRIKRDGFEVKDALGKKHKLTSARRGLNCRRV